MKLHMSEYRNEMCDHMIELTSHCHACVALHRYAIRRQRGATAVPLLAIWLIAAAVLIEAIIR